MFPMGGATVVAIRMGRGDKKGANHAFMTAFSITLLVSVVLMTVGMVFSHQIVDLSGAKNLSAEMRKMSAQYLFYCSAFSVPCSWVLVCPYLFATMVRPRFLLSECVQVRPPISFLTGCLFFRFKWVLSALPLLLGWGRY